MVGYPRYFQVPAGDAVLKHPLYLKYNGYSVYEIGQFEGGQGKKNLINEMENIMVNIDNMAILWFLQNLLELMNLLGY